MPGARRTRSLVCKGRKHTSSHHRYAEQSGTPCAMVYGLYALSPVSGLDSHRRSARRVGPVRADIAVSQSLIPASGDQDHTISPHASASHVR